MERDGPATVRRAATRSAEAHWAKWPYNAVVPRPRRYTRRHGGRGTVSMDPRTQQGLSPGNPGRGSWRSRRLPGGSDRRPGERRRRPRSRSTARTPWCTSTARVGHPAADSYHEEFRAGGRSYDVQLHHGLAFRSGDSVTMTGQLQGATLERPARRRSPSSPRTSRPSAAPPRCSSCSPPGPQPDAMTQATAAASSTGTARGSSRRRTGTCRWRRPSPRGCT